MPDDDEEFIDLYENEPGHWERRPPPAFPNPRPLDPVQPEWAREMHENTAGCMPLLWFVVVTIAGAGILMMIAP